MTTVLVCGSRNWEDAVVIRWALTKLQTYDVTTIIEGEAKGADIIARKEALQLGIEVIGMPAVWKKHGKSAGPIRNRRMLEIGKPDLVIGFHEDFENSKGTADMIKAARTKNIPVMVFNTNYKTVLKVDKEGNECQ